MARVVGDWRRVGTGAAKKEGRARPRVARGWHPAPPAVRNDLRLGVGGGDEVKGNAEVVAAASQLQ